MNRAALVIETTGGDQPRIVQVATVYDRAIGPPEIKTWLAAVELGAEGRRLTGLTTEYTMTFGIPEPALITAVSRTLHRYLRWGATLVGLDLKKQLTLLHRGADDFDVPSLCHVRSEAAGVHSCPEPCHDVALAHDLLHPYDYHPTTLDEYTDHYELPLAAEPDRRDIVHDARRLIAIARRQTNLMTSAESGRSTLHHMLWQKYQTVTRATANAMTAVANRPVELDLCWPVCHNRHAPKPEPTPPTVVGWDNI